MAKERAESISVAELSGKLKGVVKDAVQRNAGLGIGPTQISFLPNPGPIIGFILHEAGLISKPLADLNKLAADVAKQVPGDARAAVLIHDKRIIVGYFPGPEPIEFRE